MKYQEHPTWRMLEKAKKNLKKLRDDMQGHIYYYEAVAKAHNSIIKMQYKLEGRLCQEK